MDDLFSSFISQRIDFLLKELIAANGEYSHAVSELQDISQSLSDILNTDKEFLEISSGDLDAVAEYMEFSRFCANCERTALYQQGFLDCVALLKKLGAI